MTANTQRHYRIRDIELWLHDNGLRIPNGITLSIPTDPNPYGEFFLTAPVSHERLEMLDSMAADYRRLGAYVAITTMPKYDQLYACIHPVELASTL